MDNIAVLNTKSLSNYPDLVTKLEEIGDVDFVTIDPRLPDEEIGNQLSKYVQIIVGTTPDLNKNVLKYCVNLKHISRQGIGYNNVDVEYANSKEILVSNVPSVVEQEDVAEFALALLLTTIKKIPISVNAVQKGEWTIDRDRYFGTRLYNKIIGIIGFGHIGKTLSNKLQSAFNTENLVYDPFISEEEISVHGAKKVELEKLLRKSEVISLHLPLTSETEHIIDFDALELVKKNCVIINTARGGLVDEKAIQYYADKSQKNLLYATDVTCIEPIPENSVLLNNQNIIITPHIAVYNKECNYDMSYTVVKNLLEFNDGDELTNIVKPQLN